ncbi:hypothetical protein BD309DRAFT_984636, partial [Dichomitus squalens]
MAALIWSHSMLESFLIRVDLSCLRVFLACSVYQLGNNMDYRGHASMIVRCIYASQIHDPDPHHQSVTHQPTRPPVTPAPSMQLTLSTPQDAAAFIATLSQGLIQPASHASSSPLEPSAAVNLLKTSNESAQGRSNHTEGVGEAQVSDVLARGHVTDLDAHYWPQGWVLREKKGPDDFEWNENKWVWSSNGFSNRKGVRTETRICMGVMRCRKCGHWLRPFTTKPKRLEQLHHTPCLNAQCKAIGAVDHIQCDAAVYIYEAQHDGQRFKVWEHSGMHVHVRPPREKMTRWEESAVDEQVLRRPGASVHQLRTGDATPGSVPLANINPRLADPRAARNAVEKSKARLGLTSGGSKGGRAVLRELGGLNNKLGMRFIIESSFSGPTYFTLESPFMLNVIRDSVQDWIVQDDSGSDAGRHSFCTDGDHSFFAGTGTLLATCAFSTVIQQWVPVLYTWIDALDTDHHRPHFRRLNKHILDVSGEQFDPKYLTTIMDFSQAQRSAHAEEFVDAMISRIAGWDWLSAAAQKLERARFLEDASKYQQGCRVHFQRSVMRIKKDKAIVPAHLQDTFETSINTLLDTTSAEVFTMTMQRLRTDFPTILQGWISWWEQDHIAAMIFPALQQGSDVEFRHSEIPQTSNPIETQHSLLHHATGKSHQIPQGIKALFAHVNQLKAQYDAAKAGHYNPSAPRSRSTRLPSMRFNENDGRAPDTYEALVQAEPAPSSLHDTHSGVRASSSGPSTARRARSQSKRHTKASSKGVVRSQSTTQLTHIPKGSAKPAESFSCPDGVFPQSPSNAIARRSLQFYTWNKNSCFYDTVLELLFHAFVLWTPESRQRFIQILGVDHKDSPAILRTIFFHYQTRLAWILAPSRDVTPHITFASIHRSIRQAIETRWDIVTPSNGYGSSLTWITLAIQEMDDKQVSSMFGVQHEALAVCSSGHISYPSRSPIVTRFALTNRDTKVMNILRSE